MVTTECDIYRALLLNSIYHFLGYMTHKLRHGTDGITLPSPTVVPVLWLPPYHLTLRHTMVRVINFNMHQILWHPFILFDICALDLKMLQFLDMVISDRAVVMSTPQVQTQTESMVMVKRHKCPVTQSEAGPKKKCLARLLEHFSNLKCVIQN